MAIGRSQRSSAAERSLRGRERSRPGRDRVLEVQRLRIVRAMCELVREGDAQRVTIADVVARSGVSRRTFYEIFEDRDACLAGAFDHAFASATEAVVPAYRAAQTAGASPAANGSAGGANGLRRRSPAAAWAAHMRAGLCAFLEFLDREPALGTLCVVDALAAGAEVLAWRSQLIGALAREIEMGARSSRRPGRRTGAAARSDRLAAEGVVGAVLAVIHERLLDPQHEPLVGLLNPLMGIIVLPYLGSTYAEREQRRPVAPLRASAQPAHNPLAKLGMRLTYRTMRVLVAVAELGEGGSHPSSRAVAEAAGVTDQGQMSKLLWRLEHLGLLSNVSAGHLRGEPNAWTLTPRGKEIERAISTQTPTE